MKHGAVCAIAGSVLLLVGTTLHPMQSDPNHALEAFAEYAADRFWTASHLLQLSGFVLIVAALLPLGRRLEATRGAEWSRLAAGGAMVSLAVATALQAVDGVALKGMVDAWAAAPTPQKEASFYAALAVRQVEIGLAAMLSVFFGLTALLYGIALLRAGIGPAWLAGLALLPAIANATAGVVMAYSGFSQLAMAISMPASLLLLAWMLGLATWMWRQCK